MTDVTADEAREPTELSAADQQLLRELTERARAGGTNQDTIPHAPGGRAAGMTA